MSASLPFLSLALDFFFLPPKLKIPMAGRYSTPLEASARLLGGATSLWLSLLIFQNELTQQKSRPNHFVTTDRYRLHYSCVLLQHSGLMVLHSERRVRRVCVHLRRMVRWVDRVRVGTGTGVTNVRFGRRGAGASFADRCRPLCHEASKGGFVVGPFISPPFHTQLSNGKMKERVQRKWPS